MFTALLNRYMTPRSLFAMGDERRMASRAIGSIGLAEAVTGYGSRNLMFLFGQGAHVHPGKSR